MKVYILSGIPGSGKTTWISKQPAEVKVICSADHYHTRWGNGVYRFNPANIQAAHDECLTRFIDALQNQVDGSVVFVDNTNLTAWEVAPYYRFAELAKAEVEVVRIWCDPLLAAGRNVHDVPVAKVFAMYQTMLREVFPPHWKGRTVLAEEG